MLLFVLVALATAAVVAFGVLSVRLLHEVADMRDRLQKANEYAASLQERLFAAWADGKAIPPASAPDVDEEELHLIAPLQKMVEDWEGPSAQEAQLKVIRGRLLEGKTQMEIYRELVGPVFAKA